MKTLQINEWKVWTFEKEDMARLGIPRLTHSYIHLGLNLEKRVFAGFPSNYFLAATNNYNVEEILKANACELYEKHETWETERQWILAQMNENEEKNSSSCSCDIIYLMNFGCPSVRNLPCRNQK